MQYFCTPLECVHLPYLTQSKLMITIKTVNLFWVESQQYPDNARAGSNTWPMMNNVCVILIFAKVPKFENEKCVFYVDQHI